jgi:predicted nucleic acid-binding protein
MTYLLDSNILLRSMEPGHAQHREAADSADLLAKQGHTLCLVPQDFYEFWVVSTRPVAQNGRGKTPDEVMAEFAFLDSHFAVFPDTPAVFDEWRRLMTAYKVTGKPSHDARFVAAMLAHGITHILTFNDQDFRRYSGITAVSPASVLASIVRPPSTP